MLATTEKGYTYGLVSIDHSALMQRDLALTMPYDSAKSFSEIRRPAHCLKLSSYVIDVSLQMLINSFAQDLTSTEMQIVDSLEKVWLVQKELTRFNSDQKAFIDSMLKWHTLKQDQKLKSYSEYCSHDLNLFLFFKDRQFFDAVVRPFLANKMEKTFTDFWLLGNFGRCIEWAGIEAMHTQNGVTDLNIAEQCLLVHVLAKKGQPQRARDIADSIRDCSKEPS